MKSNYGYVFFMFIDTDNDFPTNMPSSYEPTPLVSPIKYDDVEFEDDSLS